MTDRLTTAQWARYWRKGTITTFHGRFAENYSGPVRDHWHGIFERLPANASIVDLATGNGAVALLAAQYGHRLGRDHAITAIDTAEIDPVRTFEGKAYARHLRRIRFLANTPMEATTLETGSQHLAMSQFGFEYADAQAAVAEVVRVLRPTQSTFAAMIHHADSAIVRQAKDGIQQIVACEKSGLHGTLRDLHKRLDVLARRGRDPKNDSEAIALRTAVNERLAALNRDSTRYRDPGQIVYYVQHSMATFNPAVTAGVPMEKKLAKLHDVSAETVAYRQRMRDLISAALEDAHIASLTRRFEKAGFEIETDRPFVFEGAHFCHALTATR